MYFENEYAEKKESQKTFQFILFIAVVGIAIYTYSTTTKIKSAPKNLIM